ncbi:MAG: hypothetical protein KC731_39450, partial [Myxococcales bacterium]|nr:hypothetical protein [Myxococcales bacterium]
ATSIAKPWRGEIYLHDDAYPHPVLGHELVHALAAPHARGPFRIAGDLGGWFPIPGLVEGIAVAGSPRDDNLSADEWSAAMRRIEVLPRLESLFSLSFFEGASATSYTAAGSFVAWVRREHGAEVVSRWYGGASLPALTGRDWASLEQAWWAYLDTQTLSPAALAGAEARFDRPGVFGRRCPHVVDATFATAAADLASGDVDAAVEGYRRVLDLDPGSHSAKVGLANCYDRREDHRSQTEILTDLAGDPAMTEAVRMYAEELLGDLALREGRIDEARERYQKVLAVETNESRLRTLDIKLRYADDPLARHALVTLLSGDDGQCPYHEGALDEIGLWRAAAPNDGLPDYLFARQHLGRRHFALAARRLDGMAPVDVPRARAEAHRMRLVAACALGDVPAAEQALATYRAHPLVTASRADYYAALLARCRR